MKRLRRNAPALTLFLLAPATGELLSGSAPPVEFFNPFIFIIITGLYGSGALLVRDTVRRWRKGYLSLLCLAVAYGIFEEGIVCKSFFDPNWPDLGQLGVYGRWLGTNWVWAIWLTLYHAVVSISVPILLVEVMFPARRTDRWVAGRWRTVLLVIMALEALLGFFGISAFRPPWPHYLVTWALVLVLIPLAGRLPARAGSITAAFRRARSRFLWSIGFLWVLLSFLTFSGLPETSIPPAVTVLIGLIIAGAAGGLVLRLSGNMAAWDDRGRFLLGAGVISFFILLAPLQEMDRSRPDDPRGMTLVAVAALLLLLWQGRRVWRRTPGFSIV